MKRPLSAREPRPGSVRAIVARGVAALVGRPHALRPELFARHPELAEACWREGGLPLRIGGWCLGRSRVAGITLGRTIFLTDASAASPALLLHEVAHVRQFRRLRGFPLRYLWQSVRRGYSHNHYEIEADAFADRMIHDRLMPARSAARVVSSVTSPSPPAAPRADATRHGDASAAVPLRTPVEP